tara:strand:+ start:1783 stop:2064 length:282 start_codon:yes stop_codon:yes gene_type:complete
MFVVFKDDVTITNRGLIAYGFLDQTWCAFGKIVHKFGLPFGDPIYVNDIDVRSFPGSKRPSVVKADHSCLGASQFTNGFRQTEGSLISMPMAE